MDLLCSDMKEIHAVRAVFCEIDVEQLHCMPRAQSGMRPDRKLAFQHKLPNVGIDSLYRPILSICDMQNSLLEYYFYLLFPTCCKGVDEAQPRVLIF